MDWPQYMTMEHLLATKQGKYGTLSVVARLSTAPSSRVREVMSAVGLASRQETGNAAIVHEFEGHIHAFFTSPDHPLKLGFSDRVPGDGQLVVRTRQLKESQVEGLNDAMRHVLELQSCGLDLWTRQRTSAAFAADIWHQTFGERLEHRIFGLSNADNLGRSILELGHRERAYLRTERETVDLRISERILELTQREDSQDRSQGRGLGL